MSTKSVSKTRTRDHQITMQQPYCLGKLSLICTLFENSTDEENENFQHLKRFTDVSFISTYLSEKLLKAFSMRDH